MPPFDKKPGEMTMTEALAPFTASPAPTPSKVDALVDKWWGDMVAVLNSNYGSNWGPAVEAKDDLKRRIAAAGASLFD